MNNTWEDVHVVHLVAVASRDEDTIRALLKAHPRYAQFVALNPSLKSELCDVAATPRGVHSEYKSVVWRAFGMRHRSGDEPAVIWDDGGREWWKEGKRHRDGDNPADIWYSGSRFWYKEGKQHREGNEPAVIFANGRREWYKKGRRHRDGDEPAVISADGTREWFKEGKLHREGDKPALIGAHGSRHWYKGGKRHRGGDKPAIIRIWRTRRELEWWKEGKQLRYEKLSPYNSGYLKYVSV